MTFINRKLILSAASLAAALFLAPGSGLPTALGVASAAPLAPLAEPTDIGTIRLVKDKGPGDFKCCGNGGGGGIPPGPDKFKGGGGGDGGKGGKGGGNHHHHHWGPAIGGAIVVGLGYCSAQSARCEEEYGDNTGRYWRCMRRAGCSD
jgi:hypothetical protein